MEKNYKMPKPIVAFIPLIVLIALMAFTIRMFGGDALEGASQLSLLTASGIGIAIAIGACHVPWSEIEEQMKTTLSTGAVSILILLVIGMLSGSWMISGIVPTMICYGIELLSPKFFLLCTCVICSIVSILTGSSWTTVATIGIALMGIGNALGIPEPWTAGAIISGAYFGDKISPLSDTTILASSCSDVPLFTHIRYMLGTTLPSITITLIIFLIAGFCLSKDGAIDTSSYTEGLRSTFHISAWTLIVPIFTAILIARKLPSLITLFLGALAAGIYAMIAQPQILTSIGDGTSFMAHLKGILITFYGSTSIATGNASLDALVCTRGMAGMLNTVWLILCAFVFGSVMIASGMLKSITLMIIRGIRSTAGLVSSTVLTGLLMNLTTCDQFLSIILSSSMFKDAYDKQGCENRLLSRTTEDSVTVTSVLIPWNSCGMTQSTVLGVATMAYFPFCFFNLISPLMSIIVACIGKGIVKKI